MSLSRAGLSGVCRFDYYRTSDCLWLIKEKVLSCLKYQEFWMYPIRTRGFTYFWVFGNLEDLVRKVLLRTQRVIWRTMLMDILSFHLLEWWVKLFRIAQQSIIKHLRLWLKPVVTEILHDTKIGKTVGFSRINL